MDGGGSRAMSFRPEVIADSSGKWVPNGLRFTTREEAQACVEEQAARWWLVTDYRVVEVDDPVNYRWGEHGLVPIETLEPHK